MWNCEQRRRRQPNERMNRGKLCTNENGSHFGANMAKIASFIHGSLPFYQYISCVGEVEAPEQKKVVTREKYMALCCCDKNFLCIRRLSFVFIYLFFLSSSSFCQRLQGHCNWARLPAVLAEGNVSCNNFKCALFWMIANKCVCVREAENTYDIFSAFLLFSHAATNKLPHLATLCARPLQT